MKSRFLEFLAVYKTCFAYQNAPASVPVALHSAVGKKVTAKSVVARNSVNTRFCVYDFRAQTAIFTFAMKIAANGLFPDLVLLSGGILCLFLSLSVSSFADPEAATPTAKPTPSVQSSSSPSPTPLEELKDQQFAGLRRRRLDVISRIDKNKADIAALQAQVAELNATRTTMNKQLKGWQTADETPAKAALDDAKTDLSELKSKGRTPDQTQEDYNKALQIANSRVAFYQDRLDAIQKAARDKIDLENQLASTESDLQQASGALSEALATKDKLTTEQLSIEDSINALLIPETEQNSFKFTITVAFSILVGLVIAGFFAISWHDQVVRQAIFSGQSGIQFLTLFSLVIAIILFGITGILEGKELAALLGGLSGYILGRVTDRDRPSESTPPPKASGG